MDLLDEAMGGTIDHSVVLRCTQVALLCVEVHPKNIPMMSSVVITSIIYYLLVVSEAVVCAWYLQTTVFVMASEF